MADVDIEKIRQVIANLLAEGDEVGAAAVWNLKDEYLKLQAVILANPNSHRGNDFRFNFLSIPANAEDREIFNRWDLNLRKEKEYGIERGSAVEWHWAQFVINNGPVTIAMAEHASKSDPEGWKQAAYELEEEGQ